MSAVAPSAYLQRTRTHTHTRNSHNTRNRCWASRCRQRRSSQVRVGCEMCVGRVCVGVGCQVCIGVGCRVCIGVGCRVFVGRRSWQVRARKCMVAEYLGCSTARYRMYILTPYASVPQRLWARQSCVGSCSSAWQETRHLWWPLSIYSIYICIYIYTYLYISIYIYIYIYTYIGIYI